MPCPLNLFAPLRHDPRKLAQGAGVETGGSGEGDGFAQPEFRFASVSHHVNVDGFAWIAFVGVEEEPETRVAKDGWHVREDSAGWRGNHEGFLSETNVPYSAPGWGRAPLRGTLTPLSLKMDPGAPPVHATKGPLDLLPGQGPDWRSPIHLEC